MSTKNPRSRAEKILEARIKVEPIPPYEWGPTWIRDTQIKGFACRVLPSGAKSFVWEGRVKGRTRRITIGQYPDLSVVVARGKADGMRSARAEGRDPMSERKAAKIAEKARQEAERTAATVQTLIDAYMEQYAKPRKKSWRQDQKLIDLYIPKSMRARKLGEITSADLVRLHTEIGKRGHYVANAAIRLIRSMFNWGSDLYKGENPTSKVHFFDERPHDRYLTPEELKKVNQALIDEPDWRWQAFFPLAVMLGLRRSELCSLRFDCIDFKARTLRLPDSKNGRPHLLPLPPPAMRIIEGLPSRGVSEWVFPSDSKSGHVVEPAKAWSRIRDAAGVPDVRIHSLRHTLASWMLAQGFSMPVIARALNHSRLAVTERYAHLELDPVRIALERTAELMTRN